MGKKGETSCDAVTDVITRCMNEPGRANCIYANFFQNRNDSNSDLPLKVKEFDIFKKYTFIFIQVH